MLSFTYHSTSLFTRLTVIFYLSFGQCFASEPRFNPSPAVGFDLGQSYGTAVAHLSNGTVISLAKVQGSSKYVAFMQQEVQRHAPWWRRQWNPFMLPHRKPKFWRVIRRIIGSQEDPHAETISEMVMSLRAASEAALGQGLGNTVAITAPWMAIWQDELPSDSTVNEALRLAGLGRAPLGIMSPIYISETNAVLAANGRRICQDRFCYGAEVSEEDPYTDDVVYFISFTNQSIYVSFQLASCFFHDAWDNKMGLIDSNFGFDQKGNAKNEASFWHSLRQFLVKRVIEYIKHGNGIPRASYIVVLAGEAAESAEFLNAVREVVEDIKQLVDKNKVAPKVEMVASNDPVYAAARGAAFWMRTSLDAAYCDDYIEEAEREGNDSRSEKHETSGHSYDEL